MSDYKFTTSNNFLDRHTFNVYNKLYEKRCYILDCLRKGLIKFNDIDNFLKNDKEFALASVSFDGLNLEFVGKKFQDDFDVVFSAVSNNYLAYDFSSDRLKCNEIILDLYNNLKEDRGVTKKR